MSDFLFVTVLLQGVYALDPMIITLIIAAIAFTLFLTELIPAPITALGAAAALMLFEVVDVKEGLSGFSNEATITVLGMLIIAGGVQRSGLVNMMAHWVIDVAAGRPMRFLAVIILSAGIFSAFVANTPVVAILMPVVITVAVRMGRSPSKYLMPLAYASTLGGMITLIGTSTNILASGISERMGYGRFSMFSLAPVGIPVFLVGGAYLLFVAYRWLPDRDTGHNRPTLKDYLAELVVQPGSELIGETVDQSSLRTRYEAEIVRIIRKDRPIDQPLVGVKIEEGDLLIVRTNSVQLAQMRQFAGIIIAPELKHVLPVPEKDILLVEATVAPASVLDGATLADVRFRNRYDAIVLAIKKREHFFQRRLHALILETGDTLLLAITQTALENLQRSPDFIIARELEAEKFRRSKMPMALAILASVVVAASLNLTPLPVAALLGVFLMIITGCLHAPELHDLIPWNLIFLLAGLIPLGIALEKTGGAALLASTLVKYVGSFDPIFVLALVYTTAMLMTEFMSNNAAVALTIPISVEVAKALQLDPFAFIMAATFGASLAFMTPIGYQTHLMVYGPGGYRFVDFLKNGAILNVICMVVALFFINMYWPLKG